ncbi:MAG TPA: TetR/AcrR family transcriptional regulator [Solirubrobacteraceae bacterium]|nr:TetR/AcrR family transcriptional regulator [Solirubrobacteraceae bacterium]
MEKDEYEPDSLTASIAAQTGPRRRLSKPARRERIEAVASELFAEHGYQGTSMKEVARRAGVTVPVVYDHFASKRDLHHQLLQRHYAELRQLWREQLAGDDPPELRIPRAIAAWFAYVETHRYAWRMLFQDTSGDPEVRADHEAVVAESRAQVMPLFQREAGSENLAGADREALEMAWEVMRGVLQGLALWWYQHRWVPRERVVATAINALWLGFERVRAGEAWQP